MRGLRLLVRPAPGRGAVGTAADPAIPVSEGGTMPVTATYAAYSRCSQCCWSRRSLRSFSCPFARRSGYERAGGSQPADDQPVPENRSCSEARRTSSLRSRSIEGVETFVSQSNTQRRAISASDAVRPRRGACSSRLPTTGLFSTSRTRARSGSSDLGWIQARTTSPSRRSSRVVVHDRIVVDLERFSASVRSGR